MQAFGHIGEAGFDAGTAAVTDAAAWVAVALIQAQGRELLLQGDVGAGGALAHLKITLALAMGSAVADHKDLAVDTDLATATTAIPYVLGTAIHQTAAGGSFVLRLAAGAGEYMVWAKKAAGNTTLRIRGQFV